MVPVESEDSRGLGRVKSAFRAVTTRALTRQEQQKRLLRFKDEIPVSAPACGEEHQCTAKACCNTGCYTQNEKAAHVRFLFALVLGRVTDKG